MNRKTLNNNPWVLHRAQFLPHNNCDIDDTFHQDPSSDEEYYGNYSFIVIENGRKRTKNNVNLETLEFDDNYALE